MGFVSAFANSGSIGSTTRWAIKGYESLKSNNKKMKDIDIFKEMIKIRYDSINEGGYGHYLITVLIDDFKSKIYIDIRDDNSLVAEFPGLAGLIIEILNIEADLNKNDGRFLNDMIDPLFKKLEQTNLSKKTKYGKLSRGPGSEWTNFIYNFNVRKLVYDQRIKFKNY